MVYTYILFNRFAHSAGPCAVVDLEIGCMGCGETDHEVANALQITKNIFLWKKQNDLVYHFLILLDGILFFWRL